jgi:hypothetical protein
MGTGTLEEALAWVEYCNGERDTYWANKRRQHGRADPYRVRLWGLGNEMYGEWQIGAMSADEYVREATRWARGLRFLDPGIQLVSCGKTGWNEWDRIVIGGMAGLVDYHSIHIYTGSEDYWTNVLQPHQAERAIKSAMRTYQEAVQQFLDAFTCSTATCPDKAAVPGLANQGLGMAMAPVRIIAPWGEPDYGRESTRCPAGPRRHVRQPGLPEQGDRGELRPGVGRRDVQLRPAALRGLRAGDRRRFRQRGQRPPGPDVFPGTEAR